MVYIRYFWQENCHTYVHIQCEYTVLANPKQIHKLRHKRKRVWNLQTSHASLLLTPTLAVQCAYVFTVGHNRIYATYMTINLMISLPKMPQIRHVCVCVCGSVQTLCVSLQLPCEPCTQ
jgi:hypothetical protein